MQYSPKMIERLSSPVPKLAEATSYLIKLHTHNDEALFGTVTDGYLELNGIGQVAADEWVRSARTYPGLELERWLLWPDRLEGIVTIHESNTSGNYGNRNGKPRLLSSFIASYKAAAAKRINLLRNLPGGTVWQRSYQERLIPDEAVLNRLRQLLSQPVP